MGSNEEFVAIAARSFGIGNAAGSYGQELRLNRLNRSFAKREAHAEYMVELLQVLLPKVPFL